MPKRITADVRIKIQNLVDILAGFLPLSHYSKEAVTFQKIFKESHVDQLLIGGSKKRKLQNAWEEIIRRHPRLPYTLIRKIVPAAVSYRRFKRKPLKKAELEHLITCLEELGIQVRRELESIVIDEVMPEIRVPPDELVKRLENHPLAEEISSEPLELFRNGHFNEAVRKAAERYEVRIQTLSQLSETGKDLMGKAFRISQPLIALNSLKTQNEKGIQEGYQLMAMGMMRAIRNIFSHGDEHQRSPEECFEMLLFINWLFQRLPN